MPKLTVYNQSGEPVGETKVPAAFFDAPLNEAVIYQAAMAQAARRKPRTASTRTRAEVRGGGAKPWPQKGTGRARHGSIRSPIWKGGGVVFGPHPRPHTVRVPKKVRRAALYAVLSEKTRRGRVLVMEEITLNEPRTRVVTGILKSLKAIGNALIVTARPDQNLIKSARNLPGVKTMLAEQLNVLDLLNCEHLILTREALAKMEEVFAGEKRP